MGWVRSLRGTILHAGLSAGGEGDIWYVGKIPEPKFAPTALLLKSHCHHLKLRLSFFIPHHHPPPLVFPHYLNRTFLLFFPFQCGYASSDPASVTPLFQFQSNTRRVPSVAMKGPHTILPPLMRKMEAVMMRLSVWVPFPILRGYRRTLPSLQSLRQLRKPGVGFGQNKLPIERYYHSRVLNVMEF